jgi:hypothetical protein
MKEHIVKTNHIAIKGAQVDGFEKIGLATPLGETVPLSQLVRAGSPGLFLVLVGAQILTARTSAYLATNVVSKLYMSGR